MEIIDFEPRFAGAFFSLNEAWVSHYFSMEPKDYEILSDPAGQILAKGGCVFFASDDDAAVGCVALLAMADGGYEVAKMAVDPAYQGRGLGRALLTTCAVRARLRGAWRLYLESGSILTPALTLYKAFGFVDLPPERRPASPYARADIWMEMPL